MEITPFEKAYIETMGIEGGYSNDPDDPGGETWKGIARKKNPDWRGWVYIDEMKNLPGFPGNLKDDPLLETLVKDFYREHFWNHIMGDSVADLSRDIAEEMFDTAVNQGEHHAVLYLQRALNLFNRDATLYPDLLEDGSIGEKTLAAFKTYLKTDLPQLLLLWMNIFQGAYYAALKKEKYIRGWSKRITLTKEKNA